MKKREFLARLKLAQETAITKNPVTKSVLYEEPYEREYNGEVITVIGHNGKDYMVILNNQIIMLTPKELE